MRALPTRLFAGASNGSASVRTLQPLVLPFQLHLRVSCPFGQPLSKLYSLKIYVLRWLAHS